jgi:hypothetical protein
VYISLDVVCDENLFPFATYHPIAGTHTRLTFSSFNLHHPGKVQIYL